MEQQEQPRLALARPHEEAAPRLLPPTAWLASLAAVELLPWVLERPVGGSESVELPTAWEASLAVMGLQLLVLERLAGKLESVGPPLPSVLGRLGGVRAPPL